MKLFKNKKTRLIAILATNMAVLSTALVISTVSWFCSAVPIEPEDKIPSSILSRYFDMNDGVDETLHEHGTAENPYVITRPVHYYNLVRLHELGNYGFDENTYFQFGKTNIENSGNTEPLFYSYSNDGVIQHNVYTPKLNMEYYSGSLALAPIGSARHPFEGHIIGQDLTVENLHINGGGYSDIGIFGYVASHAVINHLYFESPYIDAANASAVAPSSLGHATHDSHVYIGYIAGHVYTPLVFTHVYVNNCHLFNTTGNSYEMINTYGFFGHTDEPLDSTSDSSSYTSKLNAPNAYNAVQYCYENGRSQQLARRYTNEVASGTFSGAVTRSGSSNNYNYTITQKSQNKPYSLSSIGYSSGNQGTTKYIRYIKTEGGVDTLKEITNVEPENVLTDVPVDPTYREFGGYNDGAYIYWDSTNNIWKYAEVVGDTTKPINGPVSLNCFTISYTQTVSNVTKTYYLKYKTKSNGESYDTLINEEWTSATPPTAIEYYFCFKTTFGHTGISRFTECSGEQEFYIYSPAGKKYLCTYSPQNVNNANPPINSATLVHTPVFVSETGEGPENHVHMPMKFTINGPITQITYDAIENSNSNIRNVNTDFDTTTSTKISKGALNGSNLTTFGWFGGHKMTSPVPGGEFTIGEYIDNQTTTLTNAVNFKLTGNTSEITNGSTILIAGYDGQQTTGVSTDYAMANQTNNNRSVKTVYEVRDGNNYVINDTTGVAKMTFRYVTGNSGAFTLFCDGYLYYPDDGNHLRTKDVDYDIASDTDNFCKWTFEAVTAPSQITKYRFKNVGAIDESTPDNNRYLCYNNSDHMFNCYKQSNLRTHAYRSMGAGQNDELQTLKGTDANTNPNQDRIVSKYEYDKEGNYIPNDNDRKVISNTAKWFYIYKQQTGQTIANVHYTTAVSFDIEAPVYPFKNVTSYNLKYADLNAVLTNINAYHDFTINPQYNVSFDSVQSQVHYFDALIETWKQVHLVSELQEGDQVVIVANTSGTTHYFMSKTQNNNNRGATSNVSFSPPYLAGGRLPNAAQRFTIQKNGSRFRFYTGSGYLYAASSSGNYLRTEASPDANGNADFSISIGLTYNATIVAQGNNSRNRIRFYSSGWSRYFSCFSSDSNTPVQIYKLEQSTADQTTWVGDLINDFEPHRMDAVGPNIIYYSAYMQINNSPTILSTPSIGDTFYPTTYLSNTISLLIDNNGSKDLGTLIFDYASDDGDMPYFMPSNTSLIAAGAVDTDTVNNDDNHTYLLNINAINIENLCWIHLKGEGTTQSPFKVCSSTDPEMTKYVVLMGCSSDVEIKDITFTFNAVPGNIGYSGTVDYRSATYDPTTGEFIGSSQQVTFSAISIFYDVTTTGQKISVTVIYEYDSTLDKYVYKVIIDTSGTVLTQAVSINIFKYDNNASTLIVVVNNEESDPIYAGTTSVTIPANATP